MNLHESTCHLLINGTLVRGWVDDNVLGCFENEHDLRDGVDDDLALEVDGDEHPAGLLLQARIHVLLVVLAVHDADE